MGLSDRMFGSEMSVVERELIFNVKYDDTGYVRYLKNGEYFFLDPSPFLKTHNNRVYHSDSNLPKEHTFVEVTVADERTEVIDRQGEKWIRIREVSGWRPFDPSSLARKRKIMDYEEVIDYFARPYRGEAESVQEIAGCSSLFAFSSPPVDTISGGINSAVLGNDNKWKLFNAPLQAIPEEFRRFNPDFYYHISKNEQAIRRDSRENNYAILRPKDLLSDIPVVILDESQRSISKQFRQQLEIESKIVRAYLLDSLLMQPHATKQVEKMIVEKTHELREEYYSAALLPFNQNIGGAIPKLTASFCRLRASLDIQKEDIAHVVDLWFSMRRRAAKISGSPMKTEHMLQLIGDSRKAYVKLYDIFGADTEISMAEAVRELKMDPQEFEVAVDSLVNKGYCIRRNNFIMLLEPYKKIKSRD